MAESNMIQFKRVTPDNKAIYSKYMPDGLSRGCEFSFVNIYLWGRQNIAEVEGHLVLFSQFDRKSVYPYPIGNGDRKAVLDAVIADAKSRGISCRITGLSCEAKQTIENLYPGKFRFHCDEGSFDYVYDINDLADLKGKKYHSKRNHLYRFYDAYPAHRVEAMTSNNIPEVMKMAECWYEERLKEDPNGDYEMEKVALSKAFRSFYELSMDGLVLYDGNEILAFTMGSVLYDDIMDVHFEKARPDIQGAYAAINCEFARFIREKHPEIHFLNREEDMGIEGLRKAKRSYKPHHMVEKCWAHLLEEGYEY